MSHGVGEEGGGQRGRRRPVLVHGVRAGRGGHRSEDCGGEVIRVRCTEKEGLTLSVGRGRGSVMTHSLFGLSIWPKEVSLYHRGADSRVHVGGGGWELRQLVLDKRGWASRTSDGRCLESRRLRCPAKRRGHGEGCGVFGSVRAVEAVGRDNITPGVCERNGLSTELWTCRLSRGEDTESSQRRFRRKSQ